MKLITLTSQAILTTRDELSPQKSLPTTQPSQHPGCVWARSSPDGNICLLFATGKKTRGRLTAPKPGGAQTQQVQKGYDLERVSEQQLGVRFCVFEMTILWV